MNGLVTSISRSATHDFTKSPEPSITLVAGLGVDGDAHAGVTVKHLSRIKLDPSQPNLRQVHLMHAELHDELEALGFSVAPGELGENITTRGVRLLELPTGTRLHIGASAIVEVTGLRNPCVQIERFRAGLLAAVVGRDELGRIVRKAGVMSVVVTGGDVVPGDAIEVEMPVGTHTALEPV